MIFVGPTLPGGIAQHCFNYTKLFPGSTYYSLGQEIPESSHGVVFALPADTFFRFYEYIKSRIKNITYMTVCETDTVHEDFGIMMKEFKRVAVPSEFCMKILSRQFPDTKFFVIPPYIPKPPPRPYIFYTIGNLEDPRKNFQNLLDVFSRIDRPDTILVVKQQSNCPISVDIPNVQVINEQLDDHQMELFHRQCDCYVNFSHSEGVGMGAIEAALRDKPVILSDFGGPVEYIKTPYTVQCTQAKTNIDYFLFKKDMIWGNPDPEQLLEFMRDAYDKKLRYMDHEHTKKLVSPENVFKSFDNI
jgi:glycosyltransferase involved in cell wall biosynthesis